jgi:hypothetical protein
MNSKDHVLRLAAAERELRTIPDAKLLDLIDGSEENVRNWVASLAGGADDDGNIDIAGVRGAISRGRMKGLPDKFIANVTDPLLQDCIEALGANADFPSVDQLEAVLPGLVSRHGVGAVRLMLAGAVLGEAPAVMAISKVLKTSPTLAVVALP